MTQPSYGPFDLYGRRVPPPQPPPTNNLLPWLIVGGAVFVSGLGILLVVLLRGGGTGRPRCRRHGHVARRPPPRRARARSDGRPARRRARGSDQDTGGGTGQVRRAPTRSHWRWVQAMADGDFQTAFDLSCADVRQSATDAAPASDPAWALGALLLRAHPQRAGIHRRDVRQHHLQLRVRQRHRVVHPAARRRRGVPAAGLRAVRRHGLRLHLIRLRPPGTPRRCRRSPACG